MYPSICHRLLRSYLQIYQSLYSRAKIGVSDSILFRIVPTLFYVVFWSKQNHVRPLEREFPQNAEFLLFAGVQKYPASIWNLVLIVVRLPFGLANYDQYSIPKFQRAYLPYRSNRHISTELAFLAINGISTYNCTYDRTFAVVFFAHLYLAQFLFFKETTFGSDLKQGEKTRFRTFFLRK